MVSVSAVRTPSRSSSDTNSHWELGTGNWARLSDCSVSRPGLREHDLSRSRSTTSLPEISLEFFGDRRARGGYAVELFFRVSFRIIQEKNTHARVFVVHHSKPAGKIHAVHSRKNVCRNRIFPDRKYRDHPRASRRTLTSWRSGDSLPSRWRHLHMARQAARVRGAIRPFESSSSSCPPLGARIAPATSRASSVL